MRPIKKLPSIATNMTQPVPLKVRLGLIIALCSIQPAYAFSTQIRESRLYSNDFNQLIGSMVETKTSDSHKVVVRSHSNEDDLTVVLPFVEIAESVGSSLWPGSLAGSILLHGCSVITEGRNVLELGAGLGLGGFVARRNADRCKLTDNDQSLVEKLQDHIGNLQFDDTMTATCLDWRDVDPKEQEENELYDVCMGFDVAYYFPLIAPIVNTIRQKRHKNNSLVLIVGQANRQSHWDLYHHIRDGGYNQITDEQDAPWDGTPKMLLYKFEVGEWHSQEDEKSKVDGVIPMAVLFHTTNDMEIDSLTPYDYVATKADEDSQMMSF